MYATRGLRLDYVNTSANCQLRTSEDDRHAYGHDNLGNEDVLEPSTGRITTHLVRWETQLLLLGSSNSSSRQTAISNPGIVVRPSVTSRHPSQELAIVDDEVGKGELMRVEHERCDTERHHGDPEVDQVRHPNRHRDVENDEQGAHAEVDARSRESRVQNRERKSSSCETTTCRDVTSTTECQVRQDGVAVNLR